MVVAQDNPLQQDAQQEDVEALQQRYEDAGLNPMIAEGAALARFRQQSGEDIDQVDAEILGFADQTLAQQEQLETLPEYQEALESQGFESAAAEYEDRIPEIQDLNSSEAVESRQVFIASELQERGVEPNTTEDIKDQANARLQNTAAAAASVGATAEISEEISDTPEVTEAGNIHPQLEAEQQMLNNAQSLMGNAREAGLLSEEGNTAVLEGDNYRITQQGGTTVIEGDGKKLIADGDEVLKSEGFGVEDFERFERLGQRSVDELSASVSQEQEGLGQSREQRQRQLSVQRSQGVEL